MFLHLLFNFICIIFNTEIHDLIITVSKFVDIHSTIACSLGIVVNRNLFYTQLQVLDDILWLFALGTLAQLQGSVDVHHPASALELK